MLYHRKPAPTRRKMTLPEWVVLAVVITIFLSLIMQGAQRAARRSPQTRPPSSSQQPQAGAREGQGNVIEPPSAQQPPSRPGRERGSPPVGRYVSWILWIAALVVILKAIRRARTKRGTIPRGYGDGPDA